MPGDRNHGQQSQLCRKKKPAEECQTTVVVFVYLRLVQVDYSTVSCSSQVLNGRRKWWWYWWRRNWVKNQYGEVQGHENSRIWTELIYGQRKWSKTSKDDNCDALQLEADDAAPFVPSFITNAPDTSNSQDIRSACISTFGQVCTAHGHTSAIS